jgi:hypothetical protein
MGEVEKLISRVRTIPWECLSSGVEHDPPKYLLKDIAWEAGKVVFGVNH